MITFRTAAKAAILAVSLAAALTAAGNAHRAQANLDTTQRWNTPQATSEIKHQLPLLLADSLNSYGLKAHVDFVMTDDWNALVLWRAEKYSGLVVLHRDYTGRSWRWVGATVSDDPKTVSWAPMSHSKTYLAICDRTVSGPPSAYALYQGGWIDEELEARLAQRLQQVRISNIMEAHLCDRFREASNFQVADSFDVRFFPEVIPNTPITLVGSEPWLVHDSRTKASSAIFNLSFYASKPLDIQFEGSTALAIWFPYLLDAHRHYSVRIAQSSLAPKTIHGTLKDNVLTFELPAIQIPKATVVYGTVYEEP